MKLSVILLLFCLPAWAVGGAPRSLPLIDTIEGATDVKVLSSDDTEKVSQTGAELQPGDRIETPAGVTVRIIYPDGSRLVVGPESRIQIQAVDGGTHWNKVLRGKSRVLVPKSGSKAKKFRFGTRTPIVVMGVRGTEYLVEVAADKVTVTLFSGTLEVARKESDFESSGATVLKQGQYLEATPTEDVLIRKQALKELLDKKVTDLKTLLHSPVQKKARSVPTTTPTKLPKTPRNKSGTAIPNPHYSENVGQSGE